MTVSKVQHYINQIIHKNMNEIENKNNQEFLNYCLK